MIERERERGSNININIVLLAVQYQMMSSLVLYKLDNQVPNKGEVTLI